MQIYQGNHPFSKHIFCPKRGASQHAVNDSTFQVHSLLLGPGENGRKREGEGGALFARHIHYSKKKPYPKDWLSIEIHQFEKIR